MDGVQHHQVQLKDVELHVAIASEGSPLVFVHGWPEFWAAWKPVMSLLAGKFKLIAPDLRGFGLSENPHPLPYAGAGADQHADDLVGLLDALGIKKAGFVGHDVGAYVLQRIGIRYPERATGLFFFNCPTHGIGTRWREAAYIQQLWYQTFNQMPWAASVAGATRETCRAFLGHFLTHWSHRKGAFEDVIEEWVDVFMRPGVMQGGFNWYISQNASRLAVMAGTAPAPPKIKVPAAVLWGRHDPILKAEWADVLPKYFDQIEINFAENEGHFVHYENPALAAEAIIEFYKHGNA
jgi:pimeloyl-ACP methyl ester carboxylesterase